METKFYRCPYCGNVIMKIDDGGVTPHCCGQEMTALVPGTTDASFEKHVPTYQRIDDCTVKVGGKLQEDIFAVKVKVGSEPHPMNPEHHILFIWLQTRHGGQLRYLSFDKEGHPCYAPHAKECSVENQAYAFFFTCNDPVVAVYEYCNLHGLWKLEVNE